MTEETKYQHNAIFFTDKMLDLAVMLLGLSSRMSRGSLMATLRAVGDSWAKQLTHLTFLEFTLVADLMAVSKDNISEESSGQLVHRWMAPSKSIVDS